MTQEQNNLLALKDRLGEETLSRRLQLQVKRSTQQRVAGRGNWESSRIVPVILKWLLRKLRILDRGLDNALSFQVTEIVTSFSTLPDAFRGFRILHLSDLHIDGMLDGGLALGRIIARLDYDLCVISGDFRFREYHDYDETLQRMAVLMKKIDCPQGCFGVLGNHDFIEKVPGLEKLGLRILLNESVRIEQNDSYIYLAGIDDPHFYRTHDLRKACSRIDSTDFSILLAHSPEVVKKAAEKQFNLYLCGHTHGGQICLPGGIPLVTNSFSRRRFSRGPWQYANMQGYTSRGTGSSTFPVRYFCPPEICIHRLEKSS